MNSKKLLAGLNVNLLLAEARWDYAKKHDKSGMGSLYKDDIEFYGNLKTILTNLEDDELVEKCVKKIAGRTIASQEQWRHKMGIEEELQAFLSEIKGE